MKTIRIELLNQYKAYKKYTPYELFGDLIILSGINGSGKSQLLNVIAQNGNEQIERKILQTDQDGDLKPIENILLLSFRDNINLGDDFGQFSVTYQNNCLKSAWEFYKANIKYQNNTFFDQKKGKRFYDGTIIFNEKGIKIPSWRSILKLVDLIKKHYEEKDWFTLSEFDIQKILPQDFIWRNENDIISQVGNLFYMACCERVNKQVEYSKIEAVFNNDEWLKTAPWTILNNLFEELKFKYRFKTDYEFKTPNMEENPKLRDGSEIRGLLDLSDGEKAILKLALISLDEEISKDIKLVLFDEYDAPLNPSLTEAFYRVINEFYIQKGIQVIITTHSPATISLAPESARFYEIFSQENDSPKIVEVNQYDYAELKEANKEFCEKIKNQEERIIQLETLSKSSGNMLFVEDKYDQIYKIAFLKVKGIDNITKFNFEEKFDEISNFSIHGSFSCGGLYNKLMCSNITSDEGNRIICLFDFDNEGYRKFKDLATKKEDSNKIFPVKEGTLRDGLFMKHFSAKRYALMLPIPQRLEKYVSAKTSSDCFIEVETLLSEEYLKTNIKAEIRSSVLQFYKMKDKHKNNFWEDLFNVDKAYFEDFKPLFEKIEQIFANN